MTIDKKIKYVEQDGYNNYIKNSDSVTVPRKFKSREDATPTKLAYITDAEAKQLKKQNPGTPHKGPSDIPSYDDFDAQGNYRSGAAMSAAETGGKTERDRADMRQAGIGPQEAQDIRSSAIASGAGQTVNPSFFGPKNRVGKRELQLAKAFAPEAYKATRGSRFGIGNLLGAALGFINPMLGLALRGIKAIPGGIQTFKDSPTLVDFFKNIRGQGNDEEDMSQYNQLGLYTDRITPEYYNDLGNEFALGTTSDPFRLSVGTTQGQGIPYAKQAAEFVESGNTYPLDQNFQETLKTYTGGIEDGREIGNDEQMFIDNQIFKQRFP